ncbi:hypothetical protein [Streptomyces sp. NPDC088794]|uniref:hypothetical protein n=1 Tax=Streptomyces sp. NPDC088794 TaxID=3365902 RepID=UPI0038098966
MLAQNKILVVGSVATPVDVEDLTALAFDAADRLQLPAVVATSMDFTIADFAGVVLADNWLDSTASVVLGGEALGADICCLDSAALYAYEPDTTCGHCLTVDETAAPRRVQGGWSTSVCDGCVEEHARTVSLFPAVAA